MPNELSFKVTKEEGDLIDKIVDRAVVNHDHEDAMSLSMDLTACHANGCPLYLQELLDFDDANFMHDVFGIEAHINRRTGELMHCFTPRCSKRSDSTDIKLEETEPFPERCNAVLFHGPGHQSKTTCKVRGPHTIHETPYGRYGQVARWTGDEGCTDYFDDPKEVDLNDR